MRVSDAVALWEFDPPLRSKSDLVTCPADDAGCGEASPLAEWLESTVYCELCSEHAAIVCPRCEEAFDHVWGPTFAVASASG